LERPILALAIGQTLIWAVTLYVFPASLLLWERDLGWTRADLTGAITLALFVSAILAPFAGRVIDRGLGAHLMTGAAVLAGACLIILSQVVEIWQFYLVWTLIGLAMAGGLYEPCFAVVTRSKGSRARGSITAITLIAGFASTISFPLTHFLANAFGWRATMVVFAGIAVLVVGPLFWNGASALERSRVVEPTEAGETSGHGYLRRASFWLLGLGLMCAALLHGGALHHLLPILDDRGVAPEVALLAASFIGPMQVAGRVAMMASASRTTNHLVMLVAFGSMAASGVFLMLSGVSPLLLAAFVVFFGGAYGTVSILRPVIAREVLGGRNFGAKSGSLAFFYLGGAASAPYLGSLIWGLAGYTAMIALLVALAGLGATLYVAARRLAV
jgi:predicted MFS family arabinose efflux permease